MHSRSISRATAALAVLTLLAACSSGGTTAAGPTIKAATVGSNGSLVVAGSNGMTVYSFSMDVANSGTSACTSDEACITTWPALTLSAGTTPTAGSGIAGKIGTIPRPDLGGVLQVTYNGLPLYFYSGDSVVGDSNGIYTDWNAVKP